jgi:hypothetical protein
MRSYSYEKKIQVYDNESGSHIDIGPDQDGLGLIQITQEFDKNEKFVISMTKGEAALVAKAILEVAETIEDY